MRGLLRMVTRQSAFLVAVFFCVVVFLASYSNWQLGYKIQCSQDDIRLYESENRALMEYHHRLENQYQGRNLTLLDSNAASGVSTSRVEKLSHSPIMNLQGKHSLSSKASAEISDDIWSNDAPKVLQTYIKESIKTSLASKALGIVVSLRNVPPDDDLARHKSYFMPRDTVVSDVAPRWTVQPSPCPSTGPFLLVAVPSMDEHVERRQAIRATWASPWPGFAGSFRKLVKVVFFLAVSNVAKEGDVAREAGLYGDIARGNFSDTYRNLSLKMAAVLHWSVTYCPSARHVMKVDEDTFVNLPLLLYVLKLSPFSSYVLGHRHAFIAPRVTRRGKWGVSSETYPMATFPRYLYGHSYVISGDSIPRLLNASRHMPLVQNEDSYVTGILAKSADVLRVHSDSFANLTTSWKPDRCRLVNNNDITQTNFKSLSALSTMWDMMQTRNCTHDFLY